MKRMILCDVPNFETLRARLANTRRIVLTLVDYTSIEVEIADLVPGEDDRKQKILNITGRVNAGPLMNRLFTGWCNDVGAGILEIAP